MKRKVIIASSREFTDYEMLKTSCDEILTGSNYTIISGTARGADKLGERYADERGLNVIRVPADWDTHGKSAGVIRNAEMVEMADELIAFWDGDSRGTKNMIDTARKKKLTVNIIIID